MSGPFGSTKNRSFITFGLPLAAGSFALIGGIVSLLGWILSVPRFKDWNNEQIDIKVNAAICIIAAASGLLAAFFLPKQKTLIRTAGIITAVIAGLTLSQHLTGINWGIDTLLFFEAEGAKATAAPGRMGIPASSSLTLIGIALILLTSGNLRRWTPVFAMVSLWIAVLSLIGYLFGADQLFALPRTTGIALQTASMIGAISLGLITIVPDHGVVAAMSRDDAGGMILSRLFIPLVFIALILGWLRILGQQMGLYDTAFGTSLRTLIEIAMFLGLLWWTANDISKSETRVKQANKELTDREELLTGVLGSLSDAFVSFNADLELNHVNPAAIDLFGGGADPSAVLGKNVFTSFPELKDTVLGSALVQAVTDRKAVDLEEYYPPLDRWLHARFLPSDDGGISVFALDITERKRAEQLVTRRAHELTVLYGLADRLNRSNTLNEVYAGALDTIMSALNCDRASILLFDDEGVMRFVAAQGLSDEYQEAVTGHSPWKQGESNARPMGIANIETADVEPELKEVIRSEGVTALGFIPLISNETLIGKFMVYFNREHEFTDAEFEIALTVGYQVAFAVERRRTQEALRENEERLRIATQTGKVGVWDWNILTGHVAWTESVYQMHGIPKGAFDGSVESFASLVHEEDREYVNSSIQTALSGESPYEVEFRVAKPDGGINWLFTNAIVMRDGDRPYRMIGATVDITERKIAEQEYVNLAAIVDSSGDAIIGIDLEGMITSWNGGAERLFGYTKDEALGRNVTMIIPEDRIDEEDRILARVRRGEYTEHYETIRRHKDGTLLDLSLTVSPVTDANGKIIGASKNARDITERRRTEAAMRDREIMHRLVEAQEGERHRIARDLHDHLGQQLTALRLKLESIKSKVTENNELAAELDETRKYAARIDLDVNYLAWELRPTELDQLGLKDALASFVREWSTTYGITAEFHASTTNNGRLHPEIETNLYRILQEALNNILKHADARSVNVILEQRSDRIVLIIEDDGRGFLSDTDSTNGSKGKGLGMIGMRERTALLGGTLEVESRPGGGGTTLYARVPVRTVDPDPSTVP